MPTGTIVHIPRPKSEPTALPTLVCFFVLSSSALADTDVFGITRLKASKSPPLEWTSAHWATGGKRTLTGVDPVDPTGWSRKRGNGTLMEVDGAGMLRMGGDQPRLYLQGAVGKPLFFRDVEVTGYFRRVGTDGATNGGFNVGVRSGPEGHGGDNCTANTYYLGFRYPGAWVFYKELFHPDGATGSYGRLYPGTGTMPAGKWIGMKYLAYNLPGNPKAVKLEAYIDTVSDGDPKGGGTWRKVAEIVDDGNWVVPAGDCGFLGNTVITEGGGAVLVRNTGAAEAQYKMLSVREIVPSTPTPVLRIAREAEEASVFPAFWRPDGRLAPGAAARPAIPAFPLLSR